MRSNKKEKLQFSMVDSNDKNYFLPGKLLTDYEIRSYILEGRMSGTVSIIDAHEQIRKI